MPRIRRATRLGPTARRYLVLIALACSAILMLAGSDLLAPLAAFGPG